MDTVWRGDPFSPMSFWFLNHDLEDEELRWQLREMKDKGFKGVFIHPRDGLSVPYQSELWWAKVNVIIDCCEELGLHPWLYDEDPFPSGAAGGRVVYDRPEYRARELVLETFESAGGAVDARFPIGRLVKVIAIRMERDTLTRHWLDLTPNAGMLRSTWTPGYVHHHSYYPPYEDAGNPHWRSKTRDPHFGLKCLLPEGRWKVFAFVDKETSWDDPWGGFTDLLNPQAVQYFITLTHEQYARRCGDRFGSLIPGIFTDEPKVIGVVAWTEAFPDYFSGMFGYDIRAYLPDLFATIDNRTAQVRHDYRLALGRLFKESFINPIADWCREHKLIFTGHISPEEDPVGQTRFIPYLLSVLKRLPIPGTDLITGHIGSAAYPLLHLGPKTASSAAHHTGKTTVFAEAFGSNSWGLDMQDMRKMTDWLFAMGVTDIVTHGQFYSIEGLRKKEAPPSLFYQSSHWPYFDSYMSYLSKMSAALREGVHRCRLLLYYPQATFSAYFPDRASDLERCSAQFGKLVHLLLNHQWDFDLVDEETLLEMNMKDRKLHGEQESYDVLLLGGCDYLESGAASFCERFVRQGGKVWLVGEEPAIVGTSAGGKWRSGDSAADGSYYAVKIAAERLLGELEKGVPREWRIRDAADTKGSAELLQDIYVHEREVNGRTRMLMMNAADEWKDGVVWRSSEAADEPTLQFQLPPHGSLLIDFQGNRAELPVDAETLVLNEVAYRAECGFPFKREMQLSHGWKLTPQNANTLNLTHWHEWESDPRPLNIPITSVPAFNALEEASPRHDGEFRLFCRFYTEGRVTTTKLVFDQMAWEGRCIVKVNGTTVPSPVKTRRYDVNNLETDITDLIHPGDGEVRLNWVEAYFPQGGRLLEPFRLYGDFTVTFPYIGFPPGQLHYGAEPKDGKSLWSWDEIGYPHYAGTMSYVREVELPAEWLEEEVDKGIFLYAEFIHDVARLYVNGAEVETRYCPPFVWNLMGQLRPGTNRLTLEVANSSVMLLEGNRKRSGMLGRVKLVQSELRSGEAVKALKQMGSLVENEN